jgi:hypothetical protein
MCQLLAHRLCRDQFFHIEGLQSYGDACQEGAGVDGLSLDGMAT